MRLGFFTLGGRKVPHGNFRTFVFCEVKTQIVGKTKFFDSLLKREIRLDAPDVLRIFCDGTVCREAAGVCNVHQSHAVPLLLIAVSLAYALLRLCIGREILEAHVAVSRAAVAAVEQGTIPNCIFPEELGMVKKFVGQTGGGC